MKKQFIILLSLFTLTTGAWAQKEYKVTKKTGRLNLYIGGAIVEGYDGNEIIFSTQQKENETVDERAKGLKAISGSGFTDNSGLGLDITVDGDDVNVNPVSRMPTSILNIKVPNNIKITVSNKSNLRAEEVVLKNLKNEIEVSTTYNKIKLEDNTGPMNIKSVYGSVDASFGGAIKGPVSIISVYSFVDVSMPAATKAKVELGTTYGKLYAAEQFKIERDKSAVNEEKATTGTSRTYAGGGVSTVQGVNGLHVVSGRNSGSGNGVYITGSGSDNFQYTTSYRDSESIKGTINGGGVDLIFKSNYNNVYLRQK